MNTMMLKPIIKKIIEYLATKDNKLKAEELNEWIKDMGFDIEVSFQHDTMIVKRRQ